MQVSTPSRSHRTAVRDFCLKNLCRGMPESVVREELDSLNIRVQGVTQLRSGHRDPDLAKDHRPTLTSFYQCREGLNCQTCDHSPNSAPYDCRWSRTWLRKASCNGNATSASATPSVYADTHPGASLVGLPHLRWALYPAGKASVLWLRGNHTANYRGCVK